MVVTFSLGGGNQLPISGSPVNCFLKQPAITIGTVVNRLIVPETIVLLCARRELENDFNLL